MAGAALTIVGACTRNAGQRAPGLNPLDGRAPYLQSSRIFLEVKVEQQRRNFLAIRATTKREMEINHDLRRSKIDSTYTGVTNFSRGAMTMRTRYTFFHRTE